VLSRERLELLLELSHEINDTVDVQSLLQRILELTLRVTESEAGTLWLVEGEHVRCTHATGPASSLLEGLRVAIGEGTVGASVAKNASVLVANALDDERFETYRVGGFRTRSAVTIPLTSRGAVLGVVELVNDVSGKDEFDERDVAFLEALADDAAAALRKAQLLDAERRARNLKALLEVSHQITSTFDVERILVSIVNLANRAVPFDRCVLALREASELRVRAISAEEKVDRKSEAVQRLEEFLLWAVERREPLSVSDVRADDDHQAVAIRRSFGPYLESSRALSLLVLPLADAEGELGALLFEFRQADALEEWAREAADLLAAQAVLALRNAQLYRDVPFISWLEPLAQKRRALMAVPGGTLLRWAAVAAVVIGVLTLVRVPLRISASEAAVRSAVQRPVRAGADGVIAALHVRSGESVVAGQAIASLRNEDLAARLEEAQGALQVARRAAFTADARGDAGGAALERARSASLGDVVAALARESGTLRVVAPSSGIVLTPRLEERLGEFRGAGEPVAWIGDPDWAELELSVRQRDIGAVQPGHHIRTRVSAHPGVLFEGTVVAVAPLAEQVDGDARYTVRAVVDNHAHLLRPGMAARARILADRVPLGAFVFRRPWRWLQLRLWW
jgi:GAF domain-containing protein/multidrug efflux pump subunit AcrA (membrane-fusion protein)